MTGIFTFTKLVYDSSGRARNIKLFSFAPPHMQSMHLAWISFCAAFFGWYAYSSLLAKTVGPDLGMSMTDIAQSNTANVAAVVVLRILIGPFVDKIGPARTMSIILVLGSIPQAFSVLSTNSAGIIASRVFISIFGAAFVPCQYWTTAFFSPEIVGSANAIVAGWGNMGAGVTNLVIPRIFNLFYYDIGLSRSLSWKLTVGVVPVVLILIIAFVCWRFGKDSPDPEFVETPSKTMNVNGKLVEIDKHIINPAARTHTVVYLLYKTFLIPAVPILMIHYACSFGVELSLDGAIGNYFIDEFGVDQSTASLFSGLFGLMNLFTRATGGVVSDLMARRFGQIGRIYWHFVIFGISTVSLIAFSYVRDISSSLALLVVFSFAVEANCGSTFGLVPFVGPFMGSTSGLVGAGGNIGAALFNVLLASYVNDTRTAFFWMGVSVGIGGFLACFLLVVNGEYILKPLFEKPEIATEDYALEMRPPRHQRS